MRIVIIKHIALIVEFMVAGLGVCGFFGLRLREWRL